MTRIRNLSSFGELKRFSILAFTVLALLGGTILLNQSVSGRYWSSWYPLYIPESEISPSLISRISEVSGGNFLYYGNAEFYYNGFNGMNSASVTELEAGDKLLQNDPRFDPFMREGGKYFKDGIYRIFYLPVSLSPLEYRYKLRSYWNNAWIFPDGKWDKTLMWTAIVFSLIALIHSRGKLLAFLMLVLYAGFAVASGNESVILPGMVTLFLMNHYGKAGPYSLFLALLVPFPGIIAMAGGMISLVDCSAFLIIYFFSLTLKGGGRKHSWRRYNRQKRDGLLTAGKDHDLFVPVPLGSRKGAVPSSSVKGGLDLIPVILQTSLLALAVLFFVTGEKVLPVSVPSPVMTPESDWSWGSFSRTERSAELPGTIEMLMHRAYQESFPYGGTWSVPGRGDSISLPVYKMDDGQIRSSQKIIRVFDEEWLKAFLQDMPYEGPGLLFSTEPGPVKVEMTSVVPGFPAWQGVCAQAVFILIGLILCLMNLSGMSGKGTEDFRMRNHLLVLRRKQQAA